jgi:anti-sigma regulatory factor (Ser/Thr protein kinase)
MKQMEPVIQLTLRNEPGATGELRRALDSIADECGLGSEERFALKLAGTEALTNALKGTSYGEAVYVRLSGCDGSVQVEVRAPGEFRSKGLATVEGGRGIPLMLALADEVEFASTAEGTRVRVRKRLPDGRKGGAPLF